MDLGHGRRPRALATLTRPDRVGLAPTCSESLLRVPNFASICNFGNYRNYRNDLDTPRAPNTASLLLKSEIK